MLTVYIDSKLATIWNRRVSVMSVSTAGNRNFGCLFALICFIPLFVEASPIGYDPLDGEVRFQRDSPIVGQTTT